MMRLAYPWAALGLLLVPVLACLRHRLREKRPTFRYSDVGPLKGLGRSLRVRLAWLPFALRLSALALALVALARPQAGASAEEALSEGIDILLAIDVSSSMKLEDFKPENRLDAAKRVVADFIDSRRNDRLGMVAFAAQAFTKSPLTLDHEVLKALLEDVSVGAIDDGTAIGTAIATSVNRLKDSAAPSRIVILLSDGVNNRGEIDPLTAAELARTFGIKIYTVGAGKDGYAPYPIDDPVRGKVYHDVRVEIDERTLRKIAETTGGKYFRAEDADSLARVYEEIDALEKTEIEERRYVRYSELGPHLLTAALVLLLIEAALARTLFSRIP